MIFKYLRIETLSMETLKYFSIKGPNRRWSDKGPDLMMKRKVVRSRVRDKVRSASPPFFYRIGDRDWVEVDSVAGLLDAFDEWHAPNSLFKVASGERSNVLFAVKPHVVPYLALDNCSPDTSVVHSLIQYRFPGIKFSGGYVWKQTSPGIWSDHAWGTAVDETENPRAGVFNDKVTDWVARMRRMGYMDFDYALGSRNGTVVIVRSDGTIEPSGASQSHLWHVHVSVVDHDGREPPRTGGVW